MSTGSHALARRDPETPAGTPRPAPDSPSSSSVFRTIFPRSQQAPAGCSGSPSEGSWAKLPGAGAEAGRAGHLRAGLGGGAGTPAAVWSRPAQLAPQPGSRCGPPAPISRRPPAASLVALLTATTQFLKSGSSRSPGANPSPGRRPGHRRPQAGAPEAHGHAQASLPRGLSSGRGGPASLRSPGSFSERSLGKPPSSPPGGTAHFLRMSEKP